MDKTYISLPLLKRFIFLTVHNEKKQHYNNLSNPMYYEYEERFILSFYRIYTFCLLALDIDSIEKTRIYNIKDFITKEYIHFSFRLDFGFLNNRLKNKAFCYAKYFQYGEDDSLFLKIQSTSKTKHNNELEHSIFVCMRYIFTKPCSRYFHNIEIEKQLKLSLYKNSFLNFIKYQFGPNRFGYKNKEINYWINNKDSNL